MPARTPIARQKQPSRANGLTTISIHALDAGALPVAAALEREMEAYPTLTPLPLAGEPPLDPETAARRYLKLALASPAVPELAPPSSGGAEAGFKIIGTEHVALTGSSTVKFRQTFSAIPVYGSLVTVELDETGRLLSLSASLGAPRGVNPVATIAPAAAVKAVARVAGGRTQLEQIVPRLHYYYDQRQSKWRLAYILEDVPAAPRATRRAPRSPAAAYLDYVVDAHKGKIIAELPRTPSVAVMDAAVDGRGTRRDIRVDVAGKTKTLRDTVLNVQTFDFKFNDPLVHEGRLPGRLIANPPAWPGSAVSAQANAAAVSQFLRDVLRRNNIDNAGGPINSSINCIVARESPGGRQWFNAFWNGRQMVYGQRRDGDKLLSLSIDLDVVGHEMFHGVTDFTARLEYAAQSGALNESYSDIFGIMIANVGNPDPRTWNWKVGEGLSPDGQPFRDMQDPTRHGQPADMRDYRVLPRTQPGDWGGVHVNSGIHNKAVYLILTAQDDAGHLVLTPDEVAAIFYLSMTQQLSRTSQFADSRRGALTSARTLFRALSPALQQNKLDAVAVGFTAVGIGNAGVRRGHFLHGHARPPRQSRRSRSRPSATRMS